MVVGKVAWISPDSKASQTPQGDLETFELEITLDRQYIQNDDKRIPLTLGQTATAEVIVRQRRVIDDEQLRAKIQQELFSGWLKQQIEFMEIITQLDSDTIQPSPERKQA